MIRLHPTLNPPDLLDKFKRFWEVSAQKIRSIEAEFDFSQGAPVHTAQGIYRSRGWTDWTLGFHYGSALLQFDATGEEEFLNVGRTGTLERMPNHITHTGVHDHGFNNLSTFGNLRRLMIEGRIPAEIWEKRFYSLAIRCSAAVQASRWTGLPGGGFIFSFNGPHSLFADTIRSLRILGLGWKLGHTLLGENDQKISLLGRLVKHAQATADHTVYYGDGRDHYDKRGRVAHECIFNVRNGSYRCPSTQQGYSGRSTWTRGLAWIILGFAELLEFIETVPEEALEDFGGKESIGAFMLKAALATSDFFIENTPSNGVPYWDTGAPGLQKIPSYLDQPADPFNDEEPVDSSAASIAAQGLLRLGRYLEKSSVVDLERARHYWQAGLTTAASLFESPYLSLQENHQGLILHSVYHRPNNWDFVPPGRRIPCGEASMWGDYHARELAVYLQRIAKGDPYLTFWGTEE